MYRPSGGWLIGLVLMQLCAAGGARAAELRWTAPEQCGSGGVVEEQVERLIGRPLREVDSVDFAVVIVAPTDREWRLVLSTIRREPDAQPRKRELAGSDCKEVTDAAAVAIAMAIEESEKRETEAGANPQNPASGATAGGVAAPAAPVPAKTDKSRPIPWRFSIGAGGVFDSGALPRPAVGGRLDLSAAFGALSLTASGAIFASQRALSTDKERGGDFQFFSVGLLVGGARDFKRFRLGGGGGFELGQISAEGTGMVHPLSRKSGWQAFLAEAGLGWLLGAGFSAVARIGAALPITRRKFVIDGADLVHCPGILTARAMLGMEFTF